LIGGAENDQRKPDGLGTEIRGIFEPLPLKGLCAGIISEDWPVWLSVFPALGITEAVAWGQHPEFISKHFAGTVPDLYIAKSKKKVATSNPDVVFVSGSPKFIYEECFNLQEQRIWATCPAKRGKRLGILSKTDLTWQLVEHADVGGVTNGSYCVGTNIQPHSITVDHDPNFRTLSNVLSVIEDGLPLSKSYVTVQGQTSPGVVCKDGLLLENSLLLVDEWNASVAAMSIFTRTRWIQRRLTSKELSIAFDLPVHLHRAWECTSGTLPFLFATRSKILMAVARSVEDSLVTVSPSQ
jgi:hypothetical protein